MDVRFLCFFLFLVHVLQTSISQYSEKCYLSSFSFIFYHLFGGGGGRGGLGANFSDNKKCGLLYFPRFMRPARRRIRLIEVDAKCRPLKQLTCSFAAGIYQSL
jgi:hypothetical protein